MEKQGKPMKQGKSEEPFTAFRIPPAIQPVANLHVAERFCHRNVFVSKQGLYKSSACPKTVLVQKQVEEESDGWHRSSGRLCRFDSSFGRLNLCIRNAFEVFHFQGEGS